MKKTIKTGQTYKTIRSGLSSASKYPDRPMREFESISLLDRQQRHKANHPKDKGVPRKNRGITFGKKTQKDKDLEEFHKNHIWTYINRALDKGWVNIEHYAKEEEE
tara:strand:- start:403 stop:720 length:318 start_codon:yes stop_codon:yes gene_type:complete